MSQLLKNETDDLRFLDVEKQCPQFGLSCRCCDDLEDGTCNRDIAVEWDGFVISAEKEIASRATPSSRGYLSVRVDIEYHIRCVEPDDCIWIGVHVVK